MITTEAAPLPDTPITTRAVAALAALTLAAFCFVTTDNALYGLLPLLADDLHVSLPTAGRLVTAYAATSAVASIPLAVLTRRIPNRHLLATVLAGLGVTTLLSALASGYWTLLAARVGTAAAQSLFWATVGPTAAGLVRPARQGRAVAAVFVGCSLAGLIGVPAGTWLGQQAGWRATFATLSVLGFLTMVATTSLLRTESRTDAGAGTGSTPDGRRYGVLVAASVLTATGSFTAYTYISPFLTTVSGFAPRDVSLVLVLSGVGGLVGNVASGALVGRNSRAAVTASVALVLAVLLGMNLLGGDRYPAAVLTALWGLAIGGLVTAMQARILLVAPGSTSIASAGNSAAFSLGTASGAGIGGAVLSAYGVRSTTTAGAVLAAVALVAVLAEPWLIARAGSPRAATPARDAR